MYYTFKCPNCGRKQTYINESKIFERKCTIKNELGSPFGCEICGCRWTLKDMIKAQKTKPRGINSPKTYYL